MTWFDDLGALFTIGGHWITLKNGKRLKLDGDGRIVAGLPARYHGTHVRDLGKLSHDERELEGIDCNDVGHCHTCKKTFRTKDEAAAAIFQANPNLHELTESEFGAYDVEFLRWQRGGRRGPKPRTRITDGRLDAINEYYDLRGAARVASLTEAVYHAIPSSRRWEDLEARLRPLEEATDQKINLPDEALRLSVGKLDVEACRADVDRRLAELFERAKAGRLEAAAPTLDDAHERAGHDQGDDAGEAVPF